MPEKLSKYVKISIFHTCTELVFSLKSAFILTMDLSLSLSLSLTAALNFQLEISNSIFRYLAVRNELCSSNFTKYTIERIDCQKRYFVRIFQTCHYKNSIIAEIPEMQYRGEIYPMSWQEFNRIRHRTI